MLPLQFAFFSSSNHAWWVSELPFCLYWREEVYLIWILLWSFQNWTFQQRKWETSYFQSNIEEIQAWPWISWPIFMAKPHINTSQIYLLGKIVLRANKYQSVILSAQDVLKLAELKSRLCWELSMVVLIKFIRKVAIM